MESTGCRGKIQCSEATAMILRKEGKEHWLHAREDMVEVSDWFESQPMDPLMYL